ncbi:DUF3048 domain-containing protein [Christensenellaceae bacterium OttesenSCG-928-K19]|nr:DUF3048 domain-containing protein [Christensenellaceae bacterium OttesenSCG-928-K19]
MKKTALIFISVLMVALLCMACAQEEEAPAATQVVSEVASAEPVSTESSDWEEVDDGAPENVSPVTGMEGTTTVYKPIVVQIENEYDARPQAGLQYADIVYETLIEGWDTRFTCVFNDIIYSADSPDQIEVGPVRSSRYYSQWIQSEWDGLYVHIGGANTPGVESNIWGASSEHIKQRINGTLPNAENADLIYRRSGTGKALEHTAYTDLAMDAEIINYEPVQLQSFNYYPLESYDEEPEIEKVEMAWWYTKNDKVDFVEYRYDAEKDKFIRSMLDVEFIAEETGEPVEVQNVIIQYTQNSDFPQEDGRKKIELFGSGKAEFFIHGKHMTGTWERQDSTVSTTYYLENGEEVTLVPGNTWIEIYPEDKRVAVTHVDGTEEIVNGN